jgi:hypothetical protein
MKLFDLSNFGGKATQRLTLQGNIISLSGNQGKLNISINDHVKVATFDTDLTTTAENFVRDNFGYYKLHGFLISAASNEISVDSAYGWWSVNTINIEVSPFVAEEALPTTTVATTTAGGEDLDAIIGAGLEIDFHAARIWRVITGMYTYVRDPVRPKNGDRIRLELTCTIRTAIIFSDKWDFVGVISPYTLLNSAFSVIEGVYDSTLDKVICEITTYESITTTATPTTSPVPTTTAPLTTL